MPDDVLMISVSGLRGTIGGSLAPAVAARFAAAAGTWFKRSRQTAGTQTSGGRVRLVLGRDSRPSGEMVERAVVAGLLSVGCDVELLGVATTPGVAVMAQRLAADGGVMITASHNPIQWNGIKILRADGVAPPPDEAGRIIEMFHHNDVDLADVHSLGQLNRDDRCDRVHCDAVLPCVDVELIRSAKLTAVVDSVHGAGGGSAKLLLEALGVERVAMYAEPTGWFPHPPEPTRANLSELCDKVKAAGADVGFAQDPDADRLAIVDDQGRYIGEEYTLALATLHLLQAGDAVAANLSTSRMIDDIAQRVGGRVLRTPVGEANVAKAMRDAGARLGGEGNGGVILPQVSQVRDSIAGMALTLELIARRKQKLSAIVDAMPAYAIVKDKVPATDELKSQLQPKLEAAFAGARIDTQDGVRVDFDNRWVHVRPSNTEPIVRLIAEAADEPAARELIAQAAAALGIKSKANA